MHGVVVPNTTMTCSLWPLLLPDATRPQEEGGGGGGAAAGALGERAQQLGYPQRRREGGGGALDRGAPRQLPDRRQRRRPRRAVRRCVDCDLGPGCGRVMMYLDSGEGLALDLLGGITVCLVRCIDSCAGAGVSDQVGAAAWQWSLSGSGCCAASDHSQQRAL